MLTEIKHFLFMCSKFCMYLTKFKLDETFIRNLPKSFFTESLIFPQKSWTTVADTYTFFAIITKLFELVVVFQTLHYGTFQIQRIWSISVSSNFRYIIWSKENRRLASSREAIINYCLPNTECCRYSCLINIKRV